MKKENLICLKMASLINLITNIEHKDWKNTIKQTNTKLIDKNTTIEKKNQQNKKNNT